MAEALEKGAFLGVTWFSMFAGFMILFICNELMIILRNENNELQTPLIEMKVFG